jgi:hypothetical protein
MVYIDELLIRGAWRYGASCHLLPETHAEHHLEELHQFAAAVGMKREWFQPGRWPHYDLTKSRRIMAVRHGAVQCTTREYILRMRALTAKAILSGTPTAAAPPTMARNTRNLKSKPRGGY